ncbi:T9SS type B sorting domain-containing protein [Maribacter sp. 2308TA10-17]|uniref:T9SS type B sorting domain-containing protein n=1 Tax=Maribacter sp. 2308TA10-17 TaxID=3386276 RepID=UPI0039BC7461
MMRTASILVLCCLLLPVLIFGQGETSNWYFGNGAGITFNSDGSVTTLTNGSIDTFEGCATISDGFGDLLFYTDGILVYNRDHKLMENGSGLLGDPSSTQSAIIVPKPSDSSIFYIFTVDTSAFTDDPDIGLNYSIVDMSLDNGKGAVTQKNIALLEDCSEKITAVLKDCSDQSIWLLTLAAADGSNATFDTYHAFEISTSGVSQQSVKSTFQGLNIEDPRGYLKVSPDGKKLVSANMRDGLYFYDFDSATGRVSNQQLLAAAGNSAYGVEFSPSNQFLYVNASNDSFSEEGHRSVLIQYDLLAPDISDSQETIDRRNIYRGALQLADNGKIYRTTAQSYLKGTPFLSVINNPNLKGAASGYEHNAIDLNGRNATQGLPPFIQSLFNKIALIKNQDGTKATSASICEGESIVLEVDIIPGATYSWEKDGILISTESNRIEILASTEVDSGKYQLTISTNDPKECPIIGEASIEVVPLPDSSLLLIEQCDIDENNDDGITLVDLEQVINEEDLVFTFYETLEDQANNISIPNPESYTNIEAYTQTIFYEVANRLGCSSTGEISLGVNPTLVNPSQFSPMMACNENEVGSALEATFDLKALQQSFLGVEVAFYENLLDASLEKNALDENIKTSSKIIYARIEAANQCLGVETIDLVVNPLPEIIMDESFQVCSDGQPILIEAPDGFDSYTWYRTDTVQQAVLSNETQITVADSGTFRLEVGISYDTNSRSSQCLSSKDFEVISSNRATFDDIIIQDLSANNSIRAMVSGDGAYEFSLDNQTYQSSPYFENLEPGFYSVFARDLKGCGITEEKIAIIGYPKFFTPNGDGHNDTWQLTGINDDLLKSVITIYDRYGRLVRQLNVEDAGWDGSYNGQTLPSSDYWFRIALLDGREFKGHFTLKR